mgnify:FL=1
MRKINVLLIGYGNTGRLIAEYVEQHGGKICGIVDRDCRLWEEKAHGVTVCGDIGMALGRSRAKVDIAVISTGSSLAAISDAARECIRRGINTITTAEEAIFPDVTAPALTSSLDTLAKLNGCTFSATGFQDCFWVNSVAAFAAACSRIDRIRGTLRYNVDEYGPSLAADHGVGLTVREFESRFNGDFVRSYVWHSNALLAEKLGWGVASQHQRSTPYVYHEALYSAALGRKVERGLCVGMSTVVTTVTKFGGVIETECTGKIYVAGDKDHCAWTLTGKPNLSFSVDSPKTPEHTAASVVNRIPQVIRAEAGYITIDKLPPAEYLTFPISLYI